jgi:NAD(P)-dependent dehydrogenase (short-subunit alcohol dehydrogenase family)
MSQVWLITGSSRGLGRAFAEAALASGFQVAATARNSQRAGISNSFKFRRSVNSRALPNSPVVRPLHR